MLRSLVMRSMLIICVWSHALQAVLHFHTPFKKMRLCNIGIRWAVLFKVHYLVILFSKIQKAATAAHSELEGRKGTISQYFTTLHCPVCDELTQYGICNKCRSQPQHVAVILNQEIRELERKQEQLVKVRLKHCQMSCQPKTVWNFKAALLLNVPSWNGKHSLGAKRVAACLLFPIAVEGSVAAVPLLSFA